MTGFDFPSCTIRTLYAERKCSCIPGLHTIAVMEVTQFPMFENRMQVYHNIRTRLLNHIMEESTPPSGRHLTDVEVMKCLPLATCGKFQRAIAAEVKCIKPTIGGVLRDYDYETDAAHAKFVGILPRPRVIPRTYISHHRQ